VRLAAAVNVLKTLLLAAIPTAAACGLGWLVAGRHGSTLFGLCALLAWAAIYWYGDRALLGMLGARPYALAEEPLLRSTVDRLSSALGIVSPKLYLIDDLFPRIFTVGRGPRSSCLAVSSGLLGALPPEELTAVLAHELAHVRRRDVLTQTFVVVVASMLVETSRIGGWFSRGLLYVLAPLAAAFVHLTLSPKRELAADQAAAAATGLPDELADALVRLDRASDLVEFTASPTTEPLYPVDPFDESRLTRMFRTHPPLTGRVAALRGVDPQPPAGNG
jgi:heat shock protein HtpX